MKQISALLAVFTLLTACGHHPGSSAPPPPANCSQGVEVGQCSARIILANTSLWSRSFSTGNSEKPETSKKITIVYGFRNVNQQPVWEREMHVTSKDGTKTMIESGIVTAVNSNKVTVKETASSCDDEDLSSSAPFDIYYRRFSTELDLDTTPVPNRVETSWNPVIITLDVVTQGVTDAIAQSVDDTLRQAFSFGSARSVLDSSQGQFQQAAPEASDAAGEIGCFSSFGEDFVQSKSSKGAF